MRRFPLGLTVVALIAFAALVGLGAWQMHRLAWKQALLARIEALQHAAARPIAPVLDHLARGGDVAFTRVSVDCAPASVPEPMVFRYALRDGGVAWRAISACRISGGPYDGILLDRGLVTRLNGAMTPAAVALPAPRGAVGVLREVGEKPLIDTAQPEKEGAITVLRLIDHDALMAVAARWGLAHPVPLLLAVEQERPAPDGVVAAALPQDIPNNHFVYAMTWFALAGILAWFYVAMVWRRLRGR